MKYKMKCVGVRFIWVITGRYLGWGRLHLVITVMMTCHFHNNNIKNIYLIRVELLARTLFYIVYLTNYRS